MRVKRSFQLHELEKSITLNPKFIYTLTSYVLILAIYVNLNTFKSPPVGIVAFFFYFLINAVFLGNSFFEKEEVFFRLMFGVLLLIMLLGFVGWIVMIIHNLDVARFTLVLFVAATFSSWLNRRMKNQHATK